MTDKGGRLDEQGMLFAYTVKVLAWAGLFELILYRLVSRLGMHLSKLAQKYEAVRITFRTLSSLGFVLLNLVSMLVFLALFIVLINKGRKIGVGRFDWLVIPSCSLLLLLTVAYLLFPPSMAASIVYNVVFLVVIGSLAAEYFEGHRAMGHRVMVATFLLGISGWLYYQSISTAYGLMQWAAAPPWAHEVNRLGEALMVLASILVFWAYGATPLWSANKRQQQRARLFLAVGGGVFTMLLGLDYWLGLYDPATAESVRKAGEGIGWIFQMGMGYTFYLPFAFYVAGLVCWSYTVIKLITVGRPAGFGLALMFIAGYALQLSHLSLMVVLGLILLTLDKRRSVAVTGEAQTDRGDLLVTPNSPLIGERT